MFLSPTTQPLIFQEFSELLATDPVLLKQKLAAEKNWMWKEASLFSSLPSACEFSV